MRFWHMAQELAASLTLLLGQAARLTGAFGSDLDYVLSEVGSDQLIDDLASVQTLHSRRDAQATGSIKRQVEPDLDRPLSLLLGRLGDWTTTRLGSSFPARHCSHSIRRLGDYTPQPPCPTFFVATPAESLTLPANRFPKDPLLASSAEVLKAAAPPRQVHRATVPAVPSSGPT